MKGTAQVFSSDFASGTYTLQAVPSVPIPGPTRLVASFTNGNDTVFNSRISLFNPSPSAGDITVRVFTLPLGRGTAQELTTTPLELGTLEARSALDIRLAEDILVPLGVSLPYTTDGGNLVLELTIQAADVRGTRPGLLLQPFLRHLSAAVIYSYRISLHWNHSAKSLS